MLLKMTFSLQVIQPGKKKCKTTNSCEKINSQNEFVYILLRSKKMPRVARRLFYFTRKLSKTDQTVKKSIITTGNYLKLFVIYLR